ncbi:MAG: SGNH/GDSL hydrolase family protein [Labilithrix sp.]
MRDRARFWRYAPLIPFAALQGALVRRRTPLLPEAAGDRTGLVDGGPGAALHLAIVGESTAVGVGVEQQRDGLAVGLARAIARVEGRSVAFQIVGESGAPARRVRQLLVALRPPIDVVVVVLGVNDVLELTRGSRWSTEIDLLVHDLAAREAREIVFTGVPPLGSIRSLPEPMRSILGARAAYLDALLRRACARTGAHHGDVTFPAREELLSRDGFHPSAEGYSFWAEALVASRAGWASPSLAGSRARRRVI